MPDLELNTVGCLLTFMVGFALAALASVAEWAMSWVGGAVLAWLDLL